VLQIVAQGPDPKQRLRQLVLPGTSYQLGRDATADLPVPWEPHLSRRHAEITCAGNGIDVRQLATATNPLYFNGTATDRCRLTAGTHFVVGKTRFLLAESDPSSHSDDVVDEVSFTRAQLERVSYHDADKRIEVLTRLPEVIAGAVSDREMYQRLTGLLLAGIVNADAIAIVERGADGAVQAPWWERRREAGGAFRPSGRLVSESLATRQSVLHVWESIEPHGADYTLTMEFDWAFCTPVGDANWGIYASGKLPRDIGRPGPDRPQLQADVKFSELVADIVASAQRLRSLEGNLAIMRQFLSPPILSTLEQSSSGRGLDPELLVPRECDVTVLFCDLRGFSKKAEASADDLAELLDRVSAALGIMTREILKHGGVTGDFLGDASLGFWGWPFGSEEAPLNACRAALGIRQAYAELARQADHPLSNFRVGIGVAHGRAMAGKIGTEDRVTVTVFGPVVNLASRLEALTKQVHVPILLDSAMADIVRARLSADEGRTRRLCKVLPYGLETPLMISELMPPQDQFPEFTDEHVQLYETGVDHFIKGDWEEAYRCLKEMPSSDRAQDFLTLRIAQHDRTAPPGWDGVIRLPGK